MVRWSQTQTISLIRQDQRGTPISLVGNRGLRVRLRAESADGLVADLKLGADGEGRSIADKAREVDAGGQTSLLVPDDTLEGKSAMLELRDTAGQVVATRGVVVGG